MLCKAAPSPLQLMIKYDSTCKWKAHPSDDTVRVLSDGVGGCPFPITGGGNRCPQTDVFPTQLSSTGQLVPGGSQGVHGSYPPACSLE